LVVINFLIPPSILERRIPKGMELNYFGDETYVSIVCSTVRKLRVLGVPCASTSNLSLQFYVRQTNDRKRKGYCPLRNYVSNSSGKWFFGSRLDAEYQKLKMKTANSGFKIKGNIPQAEYQWKVDDHWNKLRIRARNKIKNVGPKSKVGFVLEHTNLYQSIEGKTLEYKIERPQWVAWDAAQANFTCDVQRLFGKEFVKPLARRPASVFVSSGSEVTYFKPTQIA